MKVHDISLVGTVEHADEEYIVNSEEAARYLNHGHAKPVTYEDVSDLTAAGLLPCRRRNGWNYYNKDDLLVLRNFIDTGIIYGMSRFLFPIVMFSIVIIGGIIART